jgi:hypothetical protein
MNCIFYFVINHNLVKIFRIDPLAGEYTLPGHNFVTCNVPPTTMLLLAVDNELKGKCTARKDCMGKGEN